MTKKLFALAVAFVLMVLLCFCKENPVVEEKTVSIQQEIVYTYISTEMLTNGYGGVYGHQDYICYGVLDGDNICDKEDRVDYVTMRKSEKTTAILNITTIAKSMKMAQIMTYTPEQPCT